MSKKVTIGDLRRIKLAPPADDETDLVASIRKNQDSPHPEHVRVWVPDEMAAMLPEKETPAAISETRAKPASATGRKTETQPTPPETPHK